jgi:hypothetical protein
MTVTYDLATDVGKTRSLIPDRPTLGDGTANPDGVIFSDEELSYYFTLEGDSVRAAARGLEAMATDQLLLFRIIRTGQLTVDGAKLSQQLLATAKQLRESAAEIDAAEGAFDYAEMVLDPFSARQRIWNQIERRA